MSNRSTGIGWVVRTDPDEARRQILEAVERLHFFRDVAAEFGIDLRQLERYFHKLKIYGAAKRIRHEKIQDHPLARAVRDLNV